MPMKTVASDFFQARLNEKLADSLAAPIPSGTTRRAYGAVHLAGKITAVVGMRRSGKTMFLHQIRRQRGGGWNAARMHALYQL